MFLLYRALARSFHGRMLGGQATHAACAKIDNNKTMWPIIKAHKASLVITYRVTLSCTRIKAIKSLFWPPPHLTGFTHAVNLNCELICRRPILLPVILSSVLLFSLYRCTV